MERSEDVTERTKKTGYKTQKRNWSRYSVPSNCCLCRLRSFLLMKAEVKRNEFPVIDPQASTDRIRLVSLASRMYVYILYVSLSLIGVHISYFSLA